MFLFDEEKFGSGAKDLILMKRKVGTGRTKLGPVGKRVDSN